MRELSPVEAASAVAQYLPADPAQWVAQCALAGVVLSVSSDDCLCESWGDVADMAQARFLSSWLNLTPGGTAAVVEYLKGRN